MTNAMIQCEIAKLSQAEREVIKGAASYYNLYLGKTQAEAIRLAWADYCELKDRRA